MAGADVHGLMFTKPMQLWSADQLGNALVSNSVLDPFANYVPQIAGAMRAHGCANVRTAIIKGSGHYVAEEQPEGVAEFILQYASQRQQPLPSKLRGVLESNCE